MTASRSSRTRLPAFALSLTCALLGTLALSGCGAADPASTAGDPAPVTVTVTTTTDTDTGANAGTDTADDKVPGEVTIFRMSDDGTALVRSTRAVDDVRAPIRAGLVALAGEPTPAGQLALPAGTQVVGTDLRGDVAIVNLNRAYLDNYPKGGATAEAAAVAPIVFTVTEVPGVAKVLITVDGQVPQPTGSQYDWAREFSRAEFADLAVR